MYLYDKNFKSCNNEIKEGIKQWIDLAYSWTDRINRKNGYPKKVNYILNAIFIKIPRIFYTNL